MARVERTVRHGSVELATEAFGDADDRPLLLIMGMMASMLWWPDDLCERLAASGHYLIRFDNRDTGLSTGSEIGRPDYTFDDMADDAIRILDAYGIDRAHIAGMSMGGMLAQRAALRHAARIASLTVISSSPVGIDTSALPGMTPAYKAHAAKGEKVDWSDRQQFIDYVVADAEAIFGPDLPFDKAAARAFVTRDVDRAVNFANATNHFQLFGTSEDVDIRALAAPLLVIHGTRDPLLPVEHGLAFADVVKGSTILQLEGGGHELHPLHWDAIVAAVTAHTENAR